MTAHAGALFDAGAWHRAREVLGAQDLPDDAEGLDLEAARGVAAALAAAGWSYRQIGPALGVGKSTIGRWLSSEADGPEHGGGGAEGLIGLLLGAGAVAAILKAALGKRPPRQAIRSMGSPPAGATRLVRGPWPSRDGSEGGETE